MGSTIFLIGFALVHLIHMITLVVWLSHSMYVCVLGFCFRYPSPLGLCPVIWCVSLLIVTIIAAVAGSIGFG